MKDNKKGGNKMVYIETDNNNVVVYQHFFPEELSDEQKVKGYLVESVPEPAHKEGFVPIQYYTPDRGFWTDYEEDTSIHEQELQARIDELEIAVMELTSKVGGSL